MIELVFVIILIIIVLILILYNLFIKKNFKAVEKSRKRLDDLSVLNDLVKITASLKSVNEKLVHINEILIQKFSIDYSSIVIFDGKKFVAKATNLDKQNRHLIENVYKNPMFSESIQTKEAKYLTVENPTDNLDYLAEERARAKTAIFFPLYIESVFVGFWLIESRTPKGFQNLDMQIMVEVKSRILDIIRTMAFQASMENMIKEDLFSSLKTYEYLLTEGKLKLEEHNESTVIMYRISNIEHINEKYSRQAGNMTITNVTQAVEKILQQTKRANIFVRYSGPKFAIAFPGIVPEMLNDVLTHIQRAGEQTFVSSSEVEQAVIDETEDIDVLNDKLEEETTTELKKNNKKKNETNKEQEKPKDEKIVPKLNVVAAKYYRGTGLEVLTKELEDFLEELDSESSISTI